MVNKECSTDCRKLPLLTVIVKNEAGTGTTFAGRPRAVASPSRRFDRVSIAFWLGGATFATADFILGGCMPYTHPVAIAISMFWWGIYIGCLGASLGALLWLLTYCAPLSRRPEAVGHPTTDKHGINRSPHIDANKGSRVSEAS
jgi:hypothetical protein